MEVSVYNIKGEDTGKKVELFPTMHGRVTAPSC